MRNSFRARCVFVCKCACVCACVCVCGGCVYVCLQMLGSVHVYMCVWRLAGRGVGGRSKKDMKVEENDMESRMMRQ